MVHLEFNFEPNAIITCTHLFSVCCVLPVVGGRLHGRDRDLHARLHPLVHRLLVRICLCLQLHRKWLQKTIQNKLKVQILIQYRVNGTGIQALIIILTNKKCRNATKPGFQPSIDMTGIKNERWQ